MASKNHQLTAEKRIFLVRTYIETKSPRQTQKLFCKRFGIRRCDNRKIPTTKTIYKLVNGFNTHGSVENKNKKTPSRVTHSGPPLQVRTPQNVARVLESVRETPKKSVRRRSAELGIPRESVRRILKYDLGMKPYRIQMHQRLTDADAVARTNMCRWFLQKIDQDQTFLGKIWFSDEAHFYMNGQVNSKNYIFWGSQKPDEVYQKQVHDLKVTAWVAMSSQGIIGPYFFMDENSETVTVNSDRYLKMLTRFWREIGRFVGIDMRDEQYFMQDGAAPHTARIIIQWLADHFGEKVVSRGTLNPWAPHSPDLNPLDFYLWGYLKDKLCGHQFQTLEQLRNRITADIRAIPPDHMLNVVNNFVKRVRKCIDQNGRHVENLL